MAAAAAGTAALVTLLALSQPEVDETVTTGIDSGHHLIVDLPPVGDPSPQPEKRLGGAPSEPLMME